MLKINHLSKSFGQHKVLDSVTISVDKSEIIGLAGSSGSGKSTLLTRTLMIAPDVLLCDEPTSGLDVATIKDVVSLIESVRDIGVSIIIASHDLDLLTKVADKIFVLKNGYLTDSVYPKDLENPIHYLKNMYY
jgi:polar amino acid transport system ATP-binding protein